MEMKTGVEKTIDSWILGWKNGDHLEIASLYMDPCVFYSTLGDNLVTTREGVGLYFKEAFDLAPGVTVTVDPKHWMQLKNDIVSLSGSFRFHLPNKGDAPARFTWIFREINDLWNIQLHHSSVIATSLLGVDMNTSS